MKRETAKAGVCQFDSIKKALSYPSEICHIVDQDFAARSSYPPCFDSVLEHDGGGLDSVTLGNAIIQEEFNQKVNYSNSPLIV